MQLGCRTINQVVVNFSGTAVNVTHKTLKWETTFEDRFFKSRHVHFWTRMSYICLLHNSISSVSFIETLQTVIVIEPQNI
mgnify:CR=1 FL=1